MYFHDPGLARQLSGSNTGREVSGSHQLTQGIVAFCAGLRGTSPGLPVYYPPARSYSTIRTDNDSLKLSISSNNF